MGDRINTFFTYGSISYALSFLFSFLLNHTVEPNSTAKQRMPENQPIDSDDDSCIPVAELVESESPQPRPKRYRVSLWSPFPVCCVIVLVTVCCLVEPWVYASQNGEGRWTIAQLARKFRGKSLEQYDAIFENGELELEFQLNETYPDDFFHSLPCKKIGSLKLYNCRPELDLSPLTHLRTFTVSGKISTRQLADVAHPKSRLTSLNLEATVSGEPQRWTPPMVTNVHQSVAGSIGKLKGVRFQHQKFTFSSNSPMSS